MWSYTDYPLSCCYWFQDSQLPCIGFSLCQGYLPHHWFHKPHRYRQCMSTNWYCHLRFWNWQWSNAVYPEFYRFGSSKTGSFNYCSPRMTSLPKHAYELFAAVSGSLPSASWGRRAAQIRGQGCRRGRERFYDGVEVIRTGQTTFAECGMPICV